MGRFLLTLLGSSARKSCHNFSYKQTILLSRLYLEAECQLPLRFLLTLLLLVLLKISIFQLHSHLQLLTDINIVCCTTFPLEINNVRFMVVLYEIKPILKSSCSVETFAPLNSHFNGTIRVLFSAILQFKSRSNNPGTEREIWTEK